MSKTKLRKEMDKELRDKLLLKDASLLQVLRHLIRRYGVKFWGVVSKVYKSHTTLVWETLAGIGWALFVLKFWGII